MVGYLGRSAICGDTVADQAAAEEAALLLPVLNLPVTMTDFKATIKSKVKASSNVAGKTSRLPTNCETLSQQLMSDLHRYS